MSLKHITFVRPHLSDMRSSDAMEPLVFAILAARTPPDIRLRLYDERLETVPLDQPTDLVAISLDTFTARRGYQIAAAYRQRGVPVVLGGYHPTLASDEAAGHCDALCIGDAEGLWERILGDARCGRLQPRYQQDTPPALDQGPLPDRRIFAGKRYAPVGLVQFGRGCQYNCEFCSIRAFYGSSLRYRPVAQVLAEIRAQPHRLLGLVDDNLFADRQCAEDLLRGLIPLGKRWVCQASIDVTWDRDLLRLMSDSGCLAVMVGFESLEPKNLSQMNKRWNLRGGGFAAAVERLRAHGIQVYGSFVFGYDHDTPEVFEATARLAVDTGLCLANFNLLAPTPGTRLYHRLEQEGRMLYHPWWLDPEFRYGQAPFQPRGMTPEQLDAGCYRARRLFYEYGAIFRRLFLGSGLGTRPRELGLLLAANLVARREVRRKQHRPLGATARAGDIEGRVAARQTIGVKPGIPRSGSAINSDDGRAVPGK